MPDLKVQQPYPGSWVGYCLLFNEFFPRDAIYGLGPLLGQQVVGIGEIIQAKKDKEGVFLIVRTETVANNYEWTYTAGEPVYEHELDKTTGSVNKVLKSYPILTIGYKSSEEVPDALPATQVVIVKRTKRSGRTVPEVKSEG